MKKLLLVSIALAVIVVFAASAVAGEGGCPCPMKVKGAKTEVKNIDNGITVTITASDPAAVKEIQEKGAKMSGGCPMMKEGGCPMMKDGKEGDAKGCGCAKAKEGKCPMQQQSTPPAAPAPAPDKK